MTEKDLPAWVARLPRATAATITRWCGTDGGVDPSDEFVAYADLVAACPPPQKLQALRELEQRMRYSTKPEWADELAAVIARLPETDVAASPPPEDTHAVRDALREFLAAHPDDETVTISRRQAMELAGNAVLDKP
jgi:hypothetical protein